MAQSLDAQTRRAAPSIVPRWMIEGLAKELGQPVIVENKPGGVYRIGLQEVTRSPADSYAALVISMPVAVAPSISPNYPVDLRRDLTTVGRTVYS